MSETLVFHISKVQQILSLLNQDQRALAKIVFDNRFALACQEEVCDVINTSLCTWGKNTNLVSTQQKAWTTKSTS